MKAYRNSVMSVCLIVFMLALGLPVQASPFIRLEKDVPRSAITAVPNSITFDLYDSVSASTPITTQTFPNGQWWADYDFTQIRGTSESMVRFMADFSNTSGLTADMELWMELKVDGVLMGARELVKKECWALFSEHADVAATAQSADWAADADMLDGMDSTQFSGAVHPHDGGDIISGTVGEGYIDAALARDTEILSTVLAGDGSGSGLDADTLDGKDSSDFLPGAHTHDGGDIDRGFVIDPFIDVGITRDLEVMPLVLAADGSGSGLDADTLDGKDSSDFLPGAHTHDGADIASGTVAEPRIDTAIARDSEIMPTVLANDGTGSGLDADTVDGVDITGFVTQSEYDALLARVEALEAKLAHLSVQSGEINGLAGPHVIFSGANVHIRSGSGATDDGGTPIALGNLVVGYNEKPGISTPPRNGSHNIVVGRSHGYSSYGGLVAGNGNTISAAYASVSGGSGNTASGPQASVSGGQANTADNYYASVSGGISNSAPGYGANVSGGSNNTAPGYGANVSGGSNNIASGESASVGGGAGNIASGYAANVSGGDSNMASSNNTSVSGGRYNTANQYYASVSGGANNTASGFYSSISGGDSKTTNGGYESITGVPELDYMSVVTDEINGLAGPHVIFSDANVHIRSGSGATDDGGTLTGLGNLLIGYNEQLLPPVVGRGGSHNLIVGAEHEYSSHGGLVAGLRNTISGPRASVSGGGGNTASGSGSSISGGSMNTASGVSAAVAGGANNTASGTWASVSGGQYNTASGVYAASVSGGSGNTAGQNYASVSGGSGNTASGSSSSISGGSDNEASGVYASVSGGNQNLASYGNTSVSGGNNNTASGVNAAVAGGQNNTAGGNYASVSGGNNNTASGSYDWRGGGCYFCTD